MKLTEAQKIDFLDVVGGKPTLEEYYTFLADEKDPPPPPDGLPLPDGAPPIPEPNDPPISRP